VSHSSQGSRRTWGTGASGGRGERADEPLPPVEMVVVEGARHWRDPYPSMVHAAQFVGVDFVDTRLAADIRQTACA
jgi:hypothetical protein